MAFFARPACYSAPDTSFTPLFRLLDDFDKYSQDVQSSGRRHPQRQPRAFNPKFDVRETDAAYELHGELPGVDRDNVHIEFTEPQTIVIRGHVERSYTISTPPTSATATEDDASVNNAVADTEWESVANEKEATPSHQTTVSDEETETAKESGTQTQEVEKTANKKQGESKKPADKYWVSERSIGDFTRTFTFSSRVEQEGVAANLNNGILTVSVPKARKHEVRSININ